MKTKNSSGYVAYVLERENLANAKIDLTLTNSSKGIESNAIEINNAKNCRSVFKVDNFL